MKKTGELEKETVSINDIRKKIREQINERYGSVAQFLKSKSGQKFGGMKIKPYLYDAGSINFKLISELCTFFGIGKLTRKIVITRSYFYHLDEMTSDEKKMP